MPLVEVDVTLLVHDRELDVLRTLLELPEVVSPRCIDRAPHKVTTWVRELADRFHGFYHDCYVMGEGVDQELTQARLWLVEGGAHRAGDRPRCCWACTLPTRCEHGLGHAPSLLPDTASVDAGGRLSVGGVDLLDLAAEHGTPLFVYDEEHLRARCREAAAAFGDGLAIYASQSVSLPCHGPPGRRGGNATRRRHREELHVALSAGFPADRLVLHGNNKSLDELRIAHATRGSAASWSTRSTSSTASTTLHAGGRPRASGPLASHAGHRGPHARVREDRSGRLEVRIRHERRRRDTRGRARRLSPAVELAGLHAHIGSQVFAVESFRAAIEVLAPFVRSCGLPDRGGGLGVAYVEGEEAATLSQWAKVLHEAAQQHGMPVPIAAEPGRAIVASAAVTLYTVGTIKALPGLRTYVAVDGGMSDNPRPVLYGSGYEAFLPRSTTAGRPRSVRIVGKHCESGDVLVHTARVPEDIEVGDVLCTPVTGAYWHSMGSNYNKVPRPAVVFVRDGDAKVVVRRGDVRRPVALRRLSGRAVR